MIFWYDLLKIIEVMYITYKGDTVKVEVFQLTFEDIMLFTHWDAI